MAVHTEIAENGADYTREMHRLATFADSSTSICPLILARLGFRYTGRDHTIVCCHCQTEIRGWTTTDDVRRRHNSCSQYLDWSNEIPSIVSSVRQHLPTSRRTCRSSPTIVNTNRDVRDTTSEQSDETTSTIEKSNSPFYEVCEQTLFRASRKNFSDIYSSTPRLDDLPVAADIIADRTRPDFELLTEESIRFSTFHDWPERAARIVEPRDLAKAGLFYTGQADRVQCAFCRGYLRNWVQGDKPVDEHRRHFPTCSFVQNADLGSFDTVLELLDTVDRTLLKNHQVLFYQ